MAITKIKEILDDAKYLLEAQKKLLLRELEEAGVEDTPINEASPINEELIIDFLSEVFGIKEAHLTITDMGKITNWLQRRRKC